MMDIIDTPEDPIEKVYWSIGEVAKMFRISTSKLRFWETEFEMLKPMKRKRRRYYSKEQLELINKIIQLVDKDLYTLEGARRQLIKLKENA